MSTLNITDLLRELQAGEEARARIPAFEREIDSVLQKNDNLSRHNQELELAIVNYKRAISDLTATVARLEVERDDAGFRELEAQDKLTQMLDTMRDVGGMLGATIDRVSPPAPEPMPQPVVPDASVSMTEPTHYERPSDWGNFPITDHGAERVVDPVTTAQDALTKAAVDYKTATDALGQSEADPTSAPTMDTQQSAAVNLSGAEHIANASSNSSANPQAYRPFGGDAVGEAPKPTTDYPDGKRWYDKPDNMTIADWVATGGQP